MAQEATDPIVTAVKDFQNALNPAQQADLLAIHGASPPDVTAVLAFTAEVDRSTQRRNSRCVASRLHGTLQSVQEFTDIVGYLQAIKALWMPFDREFGEFVARLQQQSKQVNEEVRLASEQAADRERHLQVAERKDAARARKIGKLVYSQISSLSAEDRAWRVQTQLRETLVRKQKLLDALSTYDYLRPLRRERKKRYGGTGLWLSECKEYRDWLHDDGFGLFWLSGILGSGKTILTTAVIDDLLSQPPQKHIRVAFFLCQHGNAVSLEARTVLGCLLRQFLTVDNMLEAVENRLQQLSDGTLSDLEALNTLYSEILDTARKDNPVILIDALDEVPRSERDVLLSILGQIRSFTRSGIKILISSRQDIRGELETTFPNQYSRTMSCPEVDTDITTYIDLSIEDKLLKGDLVVGDPDLVHIIRGTLINGSNGMFLWVFFQIEDICAQHSDDAIRRVIGSLPNDLPATYQRALEKVVRNHKAEVARKMFRWVAAAKRPLSLMEIREAIAVEPFQPFSQQDKLVNDVYQLVPWCGNLLALDEEEGLVQFAHHSVKDYLQSGEGPEISSHDFRIKLRDVDHEVGEICCTYLNFSDFERQVVHSPQVSSGLDPKAIVKTSLSAVSTPTMTPSLLRLNYLRKASRVTEASDIWRQLRLTSLKVARMWPQDLQTRYYFLAYASEYWLDHTIGFSENDSCWGLFRRLVLAEKTDLAGKPWSTEEWKTFGAKVQNFILKTEHRALLSLANLEQLTHAGADLRRMVRMVRKQYSPLCSDEILQFLVDATGSVEDLWSTWDPILIIAAERGRPDLVNKVLELGGAFESVLLAKITKQLKHTPAQMDASLAYSWHSAWQQAERQGTCEMLDLLLTYKSIMLGRLKERGYEELYAAALTGNLELTTRLLNARVDPNVVPMIQSPSFDSILATAASGGSLEVVELLLRAGAEVNSKEEYLYESALVVAANRGNTLIVIALLAAGADVNAGFGGRKMAPLAAAAGHEDVKVLLLLAGAQFFGLSSIYDFRGHLSLGKDDEIKRANWLTSLQCGLKTKLKHHRDDIYSSFSPRFKDFFEYMKIYVQQRLQQRGVTDMSSIEVKKEVAAFLYFRTNNPLKRRLSEELSERSFKPEDTASEKDLYELYIDELERGIPGRSED